jgi:hypothetical protein
VADENIAEKVGGFAADAAVDTAADGVINGAIDRASGMIPGGGMVDTMLKTGVDLAANNAINAELGKVEGMFGQHPAETEAPSTS